MNDNLLDDLDEAKSTIADLEAELARLRAENVRLRSFVDDVAAIKPARWGEACELCRGELQAAAKQILVTP